jgi:carbamoyl-phosphate synthase large subunit
MIEPPSRLVGIDCNSHSVGFHWTDVSMVVPRADDPAWAGSIINICNTEKVDLVLPGIEQDVRALFNHGATIRHCTNAHILLNSPLALKVGLDKWELNQFADQHDIFVPQTWLARDVEKIAAKYPLLLKPRQGMAGKGIHVVKSSNELKEWLARLTIGDYMIQEYIGSDDEEYTVSVFGCFDETLSQPIMLRRKLNYGSTFEAETVFDPILAACATDLAGKLSICGATNFQYRKEGGCYYLIEVNPRFSSSTSIKSAFGFNEPAMAIISFLQKRPVEPLNLKKGRCSRYIEDLVVYS